MEDILNIPFEISEIPEELFVSAKEAYNSLYCLKVKKAPGPDGISNMIVKLFAFEFAPVIAVFIMHPYSTVIYHLSLKVKLLLHFPSKAGPHQAHIIGLAGGKCDGRFYFN